MRSNLLYTLLLFVATNTCCAMNNQLIAEVLKDLPQETIEQINLLYSYIPVLDEHGIDISSDVHRNVHFVTSKLTVELTDDQLWYILDQVIKLPDAMRRKYNRIQHIRWNLRMGEYDNYLHYFLSAAAFGWLPVVQVLLTIRPQLLRQCDEQTGQNVFYYVLLHKRENVIRFLIAYAGHDISTILDSSNIDPKAFYELAGVSNN